MGKSSHLFKLLMSVQSVNDYRIQDPSTDPGKYKYMYADLPESLVDLGNIVQNQLVHPWNGGEQPEGRRYEPRNNSRVEDILGQLEALNDQGLSMDRKVNDRVLACCRENALLLTSILRYQGVPARVRAGWVKYISSDPNKYADHWVTEVWGSREERWFLVDTNPLRIDLPREEFVFGGKAWLQLRAGEAKPEKFRTDDNLFYVKLNFGHDFNVILGSGPHYWEAPPIFHIQLREMEGLQLTLLDRIATLLEEPDENIGELQRLQGEHEVLQGQESAWPIFERTTYS